MATVKKTADDTYAVRCFLNKKRKFTHELTKKEARNFRAAVRHLDKYLTTQYKLEA